MATDEIDSEVFEAASGARGELPSGCCDAMLDIHECSRAVGHLGDHIAATADGVVLARWRERENQG